MRLRSECLFDFTTFASLQLNTVIDSKEGLSMRLKCLLLIGVFSLSTFGFNDSSFAQEDDIFAVPKTYAVQNRKFKLGGQYSAHGGYLPMDSFTKGFVIGASYTKYFSDFTGWEILNANYVFSMDTDLKKQLIEEFKATPGQIPDFPEWYLTTNIVYTPIYNKNLFFNKNVVWGDITFVAGPGVGSFKNDGVKPLINGGAVLRFFLNQNESFKVDIRQNLPFLSTGVEPFLLIGAAYTYQFDSKVESQSTEDDFEKEFAK